MVLLFYHIWQKCHSQGFNTTCLDVKKTTNYSKKYLPGVCKPVYATTVNKRYSLTIDGDNCIVLTLITDNIKLINFKQTNKQTKQN